MEQEIKTTKGKIEINTRISGAVATLVGTFLLVGAIGLALLATPSGKPSLTNRSLPAKIFVPCRPSTDPLVGTQIAPTSNKPCPPQYVPGELIVKFKTDRSILDLKESLVNSSSSLSLLPTPLVSLSQQRRLKKLDQVFKDLPKQVDTQLPSLTRVYKLSFPVDSNMKDLQKVYQQSSDVEYAELNFVVTTNLVKVLDDAGDGGGGLTPPVPNDKYFSSSGSWGQPYDDQWGLKRVNFSQAWAKTTGKKSVVVAVVDTGVDLTHPDLRMNLWVNSREIPGNGIDDDGNGYIDDVHGYDFTLCDGWDQSYNCVQPKDRDADPTDGHGHGTHVSGTIGATTNNGLGVAGSNWNVQLMAVKGLSDQGLGTIVDLAAGIHYAVDNGARVINMSWGGSESSSVLQEAVEYAYGHGVTLIAAAGNNSGDVAGFYPANYPNVISVAAWCPNNTDNAYCTGEPNGSRATFSNWGDGINIAAPGVEVLSLRASNTDMYLSDPNYIPGWNIVGGQFYRSSGTSMAAPHVTGLVALLQSVYPTLSPDQARSVLDISAEDVLSHGKDIYSGWGLINALPAVQLTQKIASGGGLPELVVEKSEVYWKSIIPNQTYVGEVHATISNMGFATATNIAYQAQLGVPGNYEVIVSGTVVSLSPGATTEIVQPFTLSSAPALTGTFQVDSQQTISEHLESNNFLELAVKYFMPSGWPTVTGDDVVGSPTVIDLDRNYPGLESIIGSYDGKVNAWHADGTPVPGWPITLAGLYIYSSPAVADLDGDGNLEVVIGSYSDDSKVFAWHWNGQPVVGWPISVGVRVDSTAAIADLDPSYPGLEVVIGAGDGKVYAWHANGTAVSGWPRTEVPYWMTTTPAIGDLDPSYPGLEVAAGHDFDKRFYVWHADGTVMAGWPQLLSAYPKSSPALADIDGDGKLEILVGTKDGKIQAWHANGTTVSGWPQTLLYPYANSSPSIADLDPSYPGLEVVAGATDGFDPDCNCAHSAWYVWHADGTLMYGWPKKILGTAMYSSPALADLDGDESLEIIVSSLDGGIQGWHADGSSILGFPLQPQGQIWSSPAVADLNGDDSLEVVVGSGGALGGIPNNLYAWSMPWISRQLSQPWPTPRHDIQRTGRYNPTVDVGGGDNEPPIVRPVVR